MALYSSHWHHLSGKVSAPEGPYIIYCCVESAPNLGAYDGINISDSFCGVGIWEQLRWFWGLEVVLEMLAWAVVIGKLDWAGGSTSKMAHLHVCHGGAGCWQEASVSHQVDLPGVD